MQPVKIDYIRCNGCGLCEKNCPGDLIFMDERTKMPVVSYPEECWLCGACRMDCPKDCIKIVFPLVAL
ncbi:4Fe-4S dicluster domain-containing protein [Desulfitobacterium hafniense]|nr:ferredoxin family protein [Desulfitobacterium hafniense]EHL05886.1 4Fe-4S binding domain protein [Desulfitobacterium hafniense DP7]KTE90337.1 4Fe-4S ferredoxin [Desulfitobacterium hafniense]